MPTAAAAASVPPTVVAPTAPCTAHTARSRGPSFRAVGRESLELLRRETHDDAPVDDADRRRDGAGRAHRRLAREAYLDPRGSGEPVRDEGRLQGDDRPLLGERGLDLVRDADQVLHAGEPSGRPRGGSAPVRDRVVVRAVSDSVPVSEDVSDPVSDTEVAPAFGADLYVSARRSPQRPPGAPRCPWCHAIEESRTWLCRLCVVFVSGLPDRAGRGRSG